ncbi:unnamed protein product [Allacma fusca]|uniref:Uncharacterized protein n=1 Tax=Allacma fusca TaxID=39272 RepID=A0A8J2KBR7_9HEXA|nr:unnamed protein product [Allacma fusca]
MNQAKKIDLLEKKLEKVDSSQTRQTAEIVHLKNDIIQLKEKGNLCFGIISGANVKKGDTKDAIRSAIDGVLSLTGLTADDVADVNLIPWGTHFAVRCKFQSPALVGKLLRGSLKLKNSNFKVQPDHSPEQRAVRKHLVTCGKEILADSTTASFQLKSWRYLVIKNGAKEVYYESDGN